MEKSVEEEAVYRLAVAETKLKLCAAFIKDAQGYIGSEVVKTLKLILGLPTTEIPEI